MNREPPSPNYCLVYMNSVGVPFHLYKLSVSVMDSLYIHVTDFRCDAVLAQNGYPCNYNQSEVKLNVRSYKI